MKKTISLVLSLVLLLSLFGCSNSKYSKYSKSFLDLFDTASSVTAYDISQSEFDKKYEELYAQIKKYSMLFDIYNSYDKLKNLKYINENAYKSPIKVDAEIIELLTFGKDVFKRTKGLVNISMAVFYQYGTITEKRENHYLRVIYLLMHQSIPILMT